NLDALGTVDALVFPLGKFLDVLPQTLGMLLQRCVVGAPAVQRSRVAGEVGEADFRVDYDVAIFGQEDKYIRPKPPSVVEVYADLLLVVPVLPKSAEFQNTIEDHLSPHALCPRTSAKGGIHCSCLLAEH